MGKIISYHLNSKAEAHDLEAFNSGSALGFFELCGCNIAHAFSCACSFNLIFGHKIGVLESPALFQGKKVASYTLQGHVLLL